jgi:hypothetical protein
MLLQNIGVSDVELSVKLDITGEVNQEIADYYNRLIGYMLQH